MGKVPDTATPGKTGMGRRIPFWLVVFGVFATTGFLQFASVDWSRSLSIYDEVAHIDAISAMADGEFTTWGDRYSQRTLGLAECLEQRSPDPQCVRAELRDPLDRWPAGYSYEAHAPPIGYAPFILAELVVVDESADHYSQIRNLRAANIALWLVLAAVWTALISQVTQRRLAAAAASVVVAANPLLFDRFTYVTNDGMAIVAATAVAAFLLNRLRRGVTPHWWVWLLPSIGLGVAIGLTKPTALVIVIPIALAALVSRTVGRRKGISLQWWSGLAAIGAFGAIAALAYQAFIDARSSVGFETVLSQILPRGPLDLPAAALLRIPDVAELVMGSGARTQITEFEWGLRAPSVLIVVYALLGASTFLVSLSLRNNAFPRLPSIDPRAMGFAVLFGFLAMLVLHPALHYLTGEFLMPFTAGRFQSTIIPLAGLALLPAFRRFRSWSWVMLVSGLIVAAFFSGPLSMTANNLGGVIGVG